MDKIYMFLATGDLIVVRETADVTIIFSEKGQKYANKNIMEHAIKSGLIELIGEI